MNLLEFLQYNTTRKRGTTVIYNQSTDETTRCSEQQIGKYMEDELMRETFAEHEYIDHYFDGESVLYVYVRNVENELDDPNKKGVVDN